MKYPTGVIIPREKIDHAYKLKGYSEFIHRIMGKWYRVGLTADEYEALKRMASPLVNSMPVNLKLSEQDFRRFQKRRFMNWIEEFNDAKGRQAQRMTEASIPDIPDDMDAPLILTPGGDFKMPVSEWAVAIEDFED
jgi:hypothetical protein